jgi:hypothetical protein
VEAQPAQVVGDPGSVGWAFSQQWSKMLSYVLGGEYALDEKE